MAKIGSLGKYPISKPVRSELKKVEKRLDEIIAEAPAHLRDPVKQVMKAGGKRLRPILVILSAALEGRVNRKAIDGAVAVELVHLASLIHDDILDNADSRRSVPTLNHVYGHKYATACGDYLFGLAFEMLSRCNDIDLLRPLTEASMALSVGEVMERDMAGDLKQDRDTYYQRIDKKTAALFSAACKIGAAASDQGDDRKDILSSYGYCLGMAFQIYDDVLDISGEEGALGKPVGNDIREGIVTLPVILAVKDRPPKEISDAILHPNENNVTTAIVFIQNSGSIVDSKEIAREFINKAKRSIMNISNKKIRREFISIGEFVINRYH